MKRRHQGVRQPSAFQVIDLQGQLLDRLAPGAPWPGNSGTGKRRIVPVPWRCRPAAGENSAANRRRTAAPESIPSAGPKCSRSCRSRTCGSPARRCCSAARPHANVLLQQSPAKQRYVAVQGRGHRLDAELGGRERLVAGRHRAEIGPRRPRDPPRTARLLDLLQVRAGRQRLAPLSKAG